VHTLPPDGIRGASFSSPAYEYERADDLAQLMAQANERTLVVCLIETEQGIENIDDIAAVPE